MFFEDKFLDSIAKWAMTCKTKNQTLLANKQNVNPRKINHQGMMGFVAPYTVYEINHKDTGVVFYNLHAILYWFFGHLSKKIWKKVNRSFLSIKSEIMYT